MTVLPGSLDYLYYNGIIDHIPYEAYEMLNGTNMNAASKVGNEDLQVGLYNQSNKVNNKYGSNNLSMSKDGRGYRDYTQQHDSFVSSLDNKYGYRDYTQNHDSFVYSAKSDLKDQYANPYSANKYSSLINEKYGNAKFYDPVTGEKPVSKEKVVKPSTLVKGAVGLLVMLGTAFLLVKGRKKP